MSVTNIPNNATLQFKPPGNYTRLQNILKEGSVGQPVDEEELKGLMGNATLQQLKGLIGNSNLQQLTFLRDFITTHPGLVEDNSLLDDINNKIKGFNEKLTGSATQLASNNDSFYVTASLSPDYHNSMQGSQNKNVLEAQNVATRSELATTLVFSKLLDEKTGIEGLC